MNALPKPSRPPLHPVRSKPARSRRPSRNLASQTPRRSRRVRSRRRSQGSSQPRAARTLAIENATKIAIDLVIAGATLSALVQLVPNRLAQKQNLQELRSEVQLTQNRVDRLQQDFNHYFDPQQSRSILLEQSHLADPDRVRIILQDETQ